MKTLLPPIHKQEPREYQPNPEPNVELPGTIAVGEKRDKHPYLIKNT